METLRFDNLEKYLLLKNGNYLYKIPFRDGFAVLKYYYGSRGWFERIAKTLDNVLVQGQTSFLPWHRRLTELDAIKIWRDAGFRVFDVYENVRVEGLRQDGYALYEYIDGTNLHRFLPDESIPIEERRAVYDKFLEQWHRRHRLAVERAEPRLIHENFDMKHVMVHNDELVWFDFEMCFRSRKHVDELVVREILCFLKSLCSFLPEKRFEEFFQRTVDRYEGRQFLDACYPYLFNNRNPLTRLGRWLDWNFRKKARKPHSKYNMAIKLRQALSGSDSSNSG